MSGTKLNIFEALKWTTMNPLSDQTDLVSGDPRRGSSVRFLNKTLNHMYGKNCLVNTDEFYGIVVMQFRRDIGLINQPYTMLSPTPTENFTKSDDVNVYKVYIPELECRPFPIAFNDPILATYQDVHGVPGVAGSAPGDIVRVQYRDLGNMKNPRIVGKVGEVDSNFLPAQMAEGLGIQFDSGVPGLNSGGHQPLVKIHAASGRRVENGKIPTDLLKKADKSSTVLMAEVIHNFNKLYNRFSSAFPEKKLIASGFRTFERQVSLKREKPNLAARPGTSNHGWGLAFDWNTGRSDGFESETYRWMLDRAPDYGFHNPPWARKDGKKPEWWHVDYIEKDDLLWSTTAQSHAPTPPPVPSDEDLYPEEEFTSQSSELDLPYEQ